MDARVESWDEDGDLQGDLFGQSVSTQHTSLSSRQSVHSESNAGDDDWNLQVAPNDESSKKNAITSATQLGIPIPANVPASALLGGAIRRLGKKKSRPRVDDDWAAELDFSQSSAAGLKLKSTVTSQPSQLLTPPMADQDDMDDWAEGSLGIRFGGTKRENRGRSSSISAMSPSMNSCITLESEDDGLDGLVLPEGPLDLGARLQKRKQADISASEPSESPTMLETRPQESVRQTTEADDLIAGIDFTPEDLLSKRKPTINRYVKINVTREQQPVSRSGTTLTFSDKPTTSRIPRPKPTRLDPVYEAGATVRRFDRLGPTTTSAQLLKAKRSAPLLRNMHVSSPKTSVPHGSASMQGLQSPREPPRYTSHLPRRDSDPTRGQSPTAMRSHSRLSSNMQVDSPTHTTHRRESGPSFAARDSGQKKALGRPSKRRHFGDGSELDIFDDLPTSAVKESKYVRTPLKRPSSRPALRHQQSQSKLSVQDRATTPLPPLPQTPQSSAPSRSDTVPRFAQDTTASRNAREQRLNGTRLRSGGPLMPISTNWKAQVAARSPYSSPSASRVKQKTIKQQPFLVKPLGTPVVKNENGMTYNPVLHRWEGNEIALTPFTSTIDLVTPVQTPRHPPSPPRLGLISQMATAPAARVERGMMFDPRRMCWIKVDRSARDPLSPSADSLDEDDDPFAGLEDLVDATTSNKDGHGVSQGGKNGRGAGGDEWLVGEEFDLGPDFIRRQREEEVAWRRRVEAWVGPRRDMLGEFWRWKIRDMAPQLSL